MGPGDGDKRPAALLTNAQREYLEGEKDYRPSVERDVRNRIRERVENGIRDFEAVGKGHSDDDRETILDSLEPGDVHALVEMSAFVYEAADELGLEEEKVLGEGISRAVARGDRGATVSLDIEVEYSLDGLLERFEARDPTIDARDLYRLVDAGEVSPEERLEFEREAYGGAGGFLSGEELADLIGESEDGTSGDRNG